MTQAAQKPDQTSVATQAEIGRLQNALSREHDLYRRALADFGNYRKRVQREWDGAAQAGKRQLVLALLDVMDDFERAFVYTNTTLASILVGARVIYQRLTDVLRAQGVAPYPSAGQPFNPALHEAVDVIHTEQAPSLAWCSTNSTTAIVGAMRCCDRRAYEWRNEWSIVP